MKWFIVKYIYQIITGEGNHSPQFDEQIRLLISANSTNALHKAEEQANKFNRPFKNYKGEMVRWEFICIADLDEIQPPEDGTEIISISHEPENISEFLNDVNRRKVYLEQDY